MANAKLYVGNLNYSASKEELQELFSGYGEVKDVHVLEGKGFGFVEMSTDDEATEAMNKLNGTVLRGRAMRIDVARPREERPRRSYGDRPSYGDRGGDRGAYRGGDRGGYRGSDRNSSYED